MKALSIRQPWAWAILNAGKDVENRTWPLPRTFQLPQRIYIHTGKKIDDSDFPVLRQLALKLGIRLPMPWQLVKGAILGEVTIVSCRQRLTTNMPSPWFVGPYGFFLRDPMVYTRPVPYKGRLGFFEVNLPGEDRR